jgi:hypothetical protein
MESTNLSRASTEFSISEVYIGCKSVVTSCVTCMLRIDVANLAGTGISMRV